jgi:hypothetical protein
MTAANIKSGVNFRQKIRIPQILLNIGKFEKVPNIKK